jgi:hypothetical protein
VTGMLFEYFNLMEIENPTVVEVVGDAAMPAAMSMTSGSFSGKNRCDAATEAMEHTLVTLTKVVVTTAEDKYKHFFVDDGSGPVLVGNAMYRAMNPLRLSLGDTLLSLTGIITYEYGYYEINPRDPGDIGGVQYTSGAPPVNDYPAITISEVGRCRLTLSSPI